MLRDDAAGVPVAPRKALHSGNKVAHTDGELEEAASHREEGLEASLMGIG